MAQQFFCHAPACGQLVAQHRSLLLLLGYNFHFFPFHPIFGNSAAADGEVCVVFISLPTQQNLCRSVSVLAYPARPFLHRHLAPVAADPCRLDP